MKKPDNALISWASRLGALTVLNDGTGWLQLRLWPSTRSLLLFVGKSYEASDGPKPDAVVCFRPTAASFFTSWDSDGAKFTSPGPS